MSETPIDHRPEIDYGWRRSAGDTHWEHRCGVVVSDAITQTVRDRLQLVDASVHTVLHYCHDCGQDWLP